MTIYMGTESFVPMISQWHLQDDEDIYDSINDWNSHTYLIIMKDGTETKAYGSCDEGLGGMVSTYVDLENEGEVEDILYWLEIPHPPSKQDMDVYGYHELKHHIHQYRKDFMQDIKDGELKE